MNKRDVLKGLTEYEVIQHPLGELTIADYSGDYYIHLSRDQLIELKRILNQGFSDENDSTRS